MPDRLWLQIDLIDDVVLSASAASAGDHHVLDHIPGAALLGVAASAYERLAARNLAWPVFHDGAVRFGNGYPLAGGMPTLPVPLSWHCPQRSRAEVDGRLIAEAVHDLSVATGWQDDAKPEAIGAGYVAADGTRVVPRRNFRRKTALDRREGRAKDGALFSYASLAAGQSFLAELTFDADLAAEARDAVVEALTARPIRLGRSRNVEYGRVRVTLAEAPAAMPAGRRGDGTRVRLLLASDLVLLDGMTGLPTLSPQARDVGLPEDWRLDPQHSFVAGRRYAPFNGHRRAFDAERQVLSMGSVLVFTGPHPLSDDQYAALAERLEPGLGLHRHEGAGRVLLDPWLIGQAHPSFLAAAAALPRDEAAKPGLPAGVLATWLTRRDAAARLGDLAEAYARTWEAWFATLTTRLWAEADLDGRRRSEVAPARAQWGNLRDAAERATTRAQLEAALFGTENAVCAGVAAAGWRSKSAFDPRSGELGECSAAALLADMIAPESLARVMGEDGIEAALEMEFVRLALIALAKGMPRCLAAMELAGGAA